MVDTKHSREQIRSQRIKHKARQLYKVRYIYRVEEEDVGRFHSNDRCPCSCYFCGNKRKHSGKPIQEVKIELQEKQELNDLWEELI